MSEETSAQMNVFALNFSDDVRTMERGPSLERSIKTRYLVGAREAPQFRTSLELRPRLVEAEYGTTLVLDTATMEPTAYREDVLVVPRTVAVRAGESVFCFPPAPPRTVYKSTLVYDNRRTDYWYTSAVDLAVVGTLGVPFEEEEDEQDAAPGEAEVNGALGNGCYEDVGSRSSDDEGSSRL